ncbi:MAG TPA: M28 family peptidase, partial [Armatimonadota bacterium]|nr:M28 family peptidase [Armatimonadota bacterium]
PLTIRCKVTWQSRPARNIIGVLRGQAPDKVDEALVLTCYYDSYSLVPDVSPGGEQVVSLAVMLEMARALKAYQGSMKRDIVFVATAGHAQALEGVCRLNQAIESFTTKFKDHITFEKQITEHQTKLRYVRTALDEIIGSEEPWAVGRAPRGNADYRQQWAARDPAFRKWFEECFATVAGEVNLEQRAAFLQARLDWIRAGQPNFLDGFNAAQATSAERQERKNRDPLMNAYLDAKAEDNTSGNMITTPFWMAAYNLRPTAGDSRDRFDEWGYVRKTEAYLTRLRAYHEQQIAELADSIAVRELFTPYAKTLTVNLELYSGGAQQKRDLAVLMGRQIPGTVVEPQSTDLRNAIDEKIPADGAAKPFTVTSWGSKDAAGGTNDPNIHSQSSTEMESEVWFRCARQAFTIINKVFFPGKIGTPEDTFDTLVLDGVIEQMTPIGKALLAIAHGKVGFKTIQYIPGNDAIVTFRGSVLTSAGVTAAVPNHRVGERTFVRYYQNTGPLGLSRGIRLSPLIEASPYGTYCRKFNFDLSMWGNPVTVDAARFDDRGYITFYKDASPKSQTIFKNEIFPSSDLAIGSEKPINVQLFRAAQVVCYQRGNPKTLNSFAGFNFIQKLGMQAPERIHSEISPSAPGISAFLDPDCVFYIAMLDGSAANPEVQTFRAFMMNNIAELNDEKLRSAYLTPGDATMQPPNAADGELAGKGYLAAGWTPSAMPYTSLTFPYFDAVASMIRTNGIRLAKENQYFMADKQMLESHDLAKRKLREALEFKAKGDAVNATNAAGRALSYTINNHPVIRTKISNAIIGILWYLMILVPFVFFFEKLVFGNTDIRKQLLAYGIIFVAVFALLWYFHPAFQMVNQPLIILLGFLIFLLAMIVSLMVAGKFQQTIKVLRSKEGNVEGADVNRAGVIGTAFMLGLNNMRRRKVRTGLTSVTLVLITFVMICFTSVDTSENEKQIPTGKSPSNGLMRRDPNFVPITDGEINNLTQLFGLDYPISVNYWLVGAINVTAFKNAEIFIDREQIISGEVKKSQAKVNAGVCMPWNEPDFTGIDQYLQKPNRGWFPRPPQTEKEIAAAAGTPMPDYVILPDTVASALELTPEKVYAERP